MSKLLRSQRGENDEFAVRDPTHAGDSPWDNSVNYQHRKPDAIHFQSTHWDNRVRAQNFKPDAKFINVSENQMFLPKF